MKASTKNPINGAWKPKQPSKGGRSAWKSCQRLRFLPEATRCLRRYFKDHRIRVLTDKSVEWAFLKPDRSQRMIKWAIELEEYDIEYGIDGLFEGQTDEPAEVGESNMSSNKRTFKAKREKSIMWVI
ncbi:hypothetical protein CTI12_AA209300 [Artemisia annua]|uniref:Reverse transcriptase RNase H-like domain-containing protein n=1 Tax=Artemisia annua TaxID=35608 RepID=A0A2U1P0S6_ARTAN|nr:hypothetical protein CTI12_AA209300 [Artemisia annua]